MAAKPHEVHITPGTKEGVYLALRVFGDLEGANISWTVGHPEYPIVVEVFTEEVGLEKKRFRKAGFTIEEVEI